MSQSHDKKISESKKWKDAILKSGIPYEYEVSSFLTEKAFKCSFDRGYFRKNENQIEKEFSYDILAEKSFKDHNVELKLHVECKYCHAETKWVFIPDLSSNSFTNMLENVHPTSWMSPMDAMTKKLKFEFDHISEELAPICLKGIQITSSDRAPNKIPRAVAQLSYSFANELMNSLGVQKLNALAGKDQLFYHIPVIITTAELFRLKDGVTIQEVENCNTIEEISEQVQILVLSNKDQLELRKFNEEKLKEYVKDPMNLEISELIKKSFTRDILNYPEAIVILHYQKGNQKGFERLEDVIGKIVERDEEYLNTSTKINKFLNVFVDHTMKKID